MGTGEKSSVLLHILGKYFGVMWLKPLTNFQKLYKIKYNFGARKPIKWGFVRDKSVSYPTKYPNFIFYCFKRLCDER